MNKLMLLVLFFLCISCMSKADVARMKAECDGNLIQLYSGCHCFRHFENDSTDIIKVDLSDDDCSN